MNLFLRRSVHADIRGVNIYVRNLRLSWAELKLHVSGPHNSSQLEEQCRYTKRPTKGRIYSPQYCYSPGPTDNQNELLQRSELTYCSLYLLSVEFVPLLNQCKYELVHGGEWTQAARGIAGPANVSLCLASTPWGRQKEPVLFCVHLFSTWQKLVNFVHVHWA